MLVNGVQLRLTPLHHIPYIYFYTSITLIIYLLSYLLLNLSSTLLSLLHLPLHFPPSSIRLTICVRTSSNSFYISSFPLPTPQYPYDTYPAISYLFFPTLLYILLYYMIDVSTLL